MSTPTSTALGVGQTPTAVAPVGQMAPWVKWALAGILAAAAFGIYWMLMRKPGHKGHAAKETGKPKKKVKRKKSKK